MTLCYQQAGRPASCGPWVVPRGFSTVSREMVTFSPHLLGEQGQLLQQVCRQDGTVTKLLVATGFSV